MSNTESDERGAQDFEIACPVEEEREVVAQVNAERASRGLAALELDVRLGAAAIRHSEDMAGGCFLSHTGSDGSEPGQRISQAKYASSTWGENVAYGHANASGVVKAWLASPDHRANILNPSFHHIGVGHVPEGPHFWTQVFAAGEARAVSCEDPPRGGERATGRAAGAMR